MRFHTGQHQHYCGIDLHARTLHLCILDGGGLLPVAYVYPPEMRSTRDLLRRRTHFVRPGPMIPTPCSG